MPISRAASAGPNQQSERGAKALLAVVVLVAAALAFGLAGYSLSQSRLQHERVAEMVTRNLANSVVLTVSGSVEKIDLTLRDLAEDLEGRLASGPIDERFLTLHLARHRERHPELESIRVTDGTGDLLGEEIAPGGKRTNFSDRDWFAFQRDSPDAGLHVTKPIVSRVTGNWIVSLSRKYRKPDGSFAGAITAAMPIGELTRTFANIDLGRHGTVVLRDADLGLIARHPPITGSEAGTVGNRTVSTELKSLVESGVAEATFHAKMTADGIERTNSVRRLSVAPMIVIVGLGTEDYLASWRNEAALTGLMLAAFVVVVLLGAWMLWRQLRIARRESARSRLFLKRASDGIHILDEGGNVVEASDSFAAMLGYEREEVLGMNVSNWDALWPAEDLLQRIIPGMLGQDTPATVETRHRRKDGSLFDVEVRYVGFAIGGASLVYASARDVSAQKAAEAELKAHRDHLEELVSARTAELNGILQALPDMYFRFDRDGTIRSFHAGKLSDLFVPPEAFLGRKLQDVLPSDTARRIMEALHELTAEDGVKTVEYMLPMPGGEHCYEARLLLSGDAAISVVRNITARRNMEAERENARHEAERLARVKSEFLANMSHEIRTPLNGVLGMAQLGLRNSEGRTKARETFARIIESGKLLLGIINDILDFSKIEAGRLEIEKLPMAPGDVMDDVANLLVDKAHAKGLRLAVEKTGSLPSCCLGDALRLSQVLVNLVSNAVKFTERGDIVIEGSREGGQLRFRVIDTGIGISPDEAKRIFFPFEQADSSTTRRFGGTGLGLAITHRIVEMMGGSITVESDPGKGSTFEVRVPYLEAVAIPVIERENQPAAPSGGRLTGLRILVAEDNEINRMVLEDALAGEGAQTALAVNGLEAVQRTTGASSNAFDLVLMDIQMPELDGLEATRLILDFDPNLPVIGQTAHVMPEDRAKCLAAGMVDHIAKPIDPEELVRKILHHIRRPRV